MSDPILAIQKCKKTIKKDIQRFYKVNHYPASYIGYDHIYTITLENQIIGAVIVSYQSENNHYALLHALLITPTNRHKGYAKQLIKRVRSEHSHIICFAERELEGLYINNGFSEITPNRLPDYLIKRYESYKKKSKTLIPYITP